MRVLSINLHFFPDSLGGATVVAEKLAHGLTELGHDVTSLYLSRRPSAQDFTAAPTPFGRSIAIHNSLPHPSNRFFNPAVASIMSEVTELIAPDLIVVHAPQHMGIFDYLGNDDFLARSVIVAHDHFWTCQQGFRTLPDGGGCHRAPGPESCRGCAWHPGLSGAIRDAAARILDGCARLVFPSAYLQAGYEAALGRRFGQSLRIANPDRAEGLLPGAAVPADLPGSEPGGAGLLRLGFMGGPGLSKGWDIVERICRACGPAAPVPARVYLFDAGRMLGRPWYGQPPAGARVAEPFHWSFAGPVLSRLDAVLMPSRVRESYGLAAREALSAGKPCLLRPAGALAELEGMPGVVTLDEAADGRSLIAALAAAAASPPRPSAAASPAEYARAILAATARQGAVSANRVPCAAA